MVVNLYNTENKYYKEKEKVALSNIAYTYKDARYIPNASEDFSKKPFIKNLSSFKKKNGISFNSPCVTTGEQIVASSTPILAPFDGNCKVGYIINMYNLEWVKVCKDILIYLDFLLKFGKEKTLFLCTIKSSDKYILDAIKKKFIVPYENKVRIGYDKTYQIHFAILNHHADNIYFKTEKKELENTGFVIKTDPVEGVPDYYKMDYKKADKPEKVKKVHCINPTRLLEPKVYEVVSSTKTLYKVKNKDGNCLYYKKDRFKEIAT